MNKTIKQKITIIKDMIKQEIQQGIKLMIKTDNQTFDQAYDQNPNDFQLNVKLLVHSNNSKLG